MNIYKLIFMILLNSLPLRIWAGGVVSRANNVEDIRAEIHATYKEFHKIARHGNDNGYDLAAFFADNPPLDLNYPTARGDTPLMGAVEHNKLLNARLLLQNHADVNLANDRLDTPLIEAIKHNNLEMVTELLKYRPNLNAQNKEGKTALMLAAKNDHDAIVGLLLKAGADSALKDLQGKSALDYARGKSKTILENYQRKLENIYRKHFQEVYEDQGVNVPAEIENLMVSYSLPASTPEKMAKK